MTKEQMLVDEMMRRFKDKDAKQRALNELLERREALEAIVKARAARPLKCKYGKPVDIA